MGRMYSAVFESVAVAALQDFFELNAPSDAVVRLHSVVITQETEKGDAEEEYLTVVIQTGATTSGSGGASATPNPNLGDAAFGGTVEVNNTTEATAGTIVNRHRESFNIRTGFFYRPTDKEMIDLSPGARLTVTLINTVPNDSITMNGTMTFEEIGG